MARHSKSFPGWQDCQLHETGWSQWGTDHGTLSGPRSRPGRSAGANRAGPEQFRDPVHGLELDQPGADEV